jgi:hypothetical protein
VFHTRSVPPTRRDDHGAAGVVCSGGVGDAAAAGQRRVCGRAPRLAQPVGHVRARRSAAQRIATCPSEQDPRRQSRLGRQPASTGLREEPRVASPRAPSRRGTASEAGIGGCPGGNPVRAGVLNGGV